MMGEPPSRRGLGRFGAPVRNQKNGRETLMGRASIAVDLRNPGQVFACLGLMEGTEILTGPCEGRFAYTDGSTAIRFELAAPGEDNPVEKVVQFLAQSEVVAIAPTHSDLSTEKWKVRTEPGLCFPAPIPESPATLPARLRLDGVDVPIEHWLDGEHSGRDNLKFWAGAAGYPGAALARDAVSCLSRLDRERLLEAASDPFAIASPMDSSFRFDWRRDYIPLDAGFSPNDQPTVGMVGYPLVELLAAVGLQYARPERIDRRDKLAYRYHVSNEWLPVVLVRAVLGGGDAGFPRRSFSMRLGWPGKKGQARCIINAEEESR
jgi:CRISPR-associated protein Csb3